MDLFSRREFLDRSAILTAAVAAGSQTVTAAEEPEPAKRGSSNDKLRVAVIGVHGRGMSHVAGFAGKNNCEVATICDCDEAVVKRAIGAVEKAQKTAPKFEQDIRKVMEDKSIDIVSIATPNHWHALAAVWAMRAGKHVYCEKPATHNVHEGRLMVQASRKYKRVCQVGTQSRSTTGMREAIQYIHDGKIGKVSLAYGTCYKPRKSIGKVDGPQEPPKSMDYDLWCGPARVIAPRRKTQFGTVHYDWHWTWEYGNGDFGNQGVHEADKARWGLNLPGLPMSVMSVGGRFGYVDDGETPNTQLNLYDFGTAQMLFEVRGLDTKDYKGTKVGNIWFGDRGYVVCPSYSSGIAYDMDGNKLQEFKGGSEQQHFDNFVKAARSGKQSDLNCDVEEGHLSAALCHLGNISYRLGQSVPLSDITFGARRPALAEAFDRMKQHLVDNKVDAKEAKCLLGRKLTIDPKTEKFIGGNVAKENDMLFREYRKGFDIVEAV